MTPSIESLVHRSLRNLKNFRSPENPEGWTLIEGEKLIGIYFNEGDECVGVSNLGLRPNKNLLVRYSEITGSLVEDSKNEAGNVILHLVDGRTLSLRFTGGTGRFRDVWEIVRFLDRVVKPRQVEGVIPPNGVMTE